MRCLNRNKTSFWYAEFGTKDPILDEYGNHTGQYTVTYQRPRKISGNISAAKGQTSTQQFGEDEQYDRVIVLENPNTPIDELCVLWIDTKPKLATNGNLVVDETGAVVTPWDYVIKRVARGLNSAAIAVSKVHVNG